jgi:hypothetical protein
MFRISFKTCDFSGISECFICYDEIKNDNKIKTECNHIYCIPCFKKYLTVKKKNNNNLSCPYCRQSVDSISLNNEKEKQLIINEFCIINEGYNIYINSLYPTSIYVFHNLYNINIISDIGLHEDIPDIIIIYPFAIYTLIFMYICYTIKIDYIILIIIGIIVGLWYLFYQILSLYNLNTQNYYFASWVLLCSYCIYEIIY